MSTKVKTAKSFEDIVHELAPNANAARTAIRVLKSFLGVTSDDQINSSDIGKLTLKKLATMTGVGEKTFVLICQAYVAFAKQ